MQKKIIFAISSYNKKYYFEPITQSLPLDIKNEIKKIGSRTVYKVNGIFLIGFYENGDLYLELRANENDFDYDEIGAGLEIEKIKKEQKELINSLQIWYRIFVKKDWRNEIES